MQKSFYIDNNPVKQRVLVAYIVKLQKKKKGWDTFFLKKKKEGKRYLASKMLQVKGFCFERNQHFLLE